MEATIRLLDTSYISHGDITRAEIEESNNFRIVRSVQKELDNWEETGQAKIDEVKRSIEQKINTIDRLAATKAYQDAWTFVKGHEDWQVTDDKRSPHALMMFYMAGKNDLRIPLPRKTKLKKRLELYFAEIQNTYGGVLNDLGLDLLVETDSIRACSKSHNQGQKIIEITCFDSLDDFFSDYEAQRVKLTDALGKVDQGQTNYNEGMRIVKYFREHLEQVVDHETDPYVLGIADSSPKSLVRRLSENGLSGKRLENGDLDWLLEQVNYSVVRILSPSTFHSDCTDLLKEAVELARKHCVENIDRNGGFVPYNDPKTDGNIVSAAYNHFGPEAKLVGVYTGDSDISYAIKALNLLRYKPGANVKCVHVS